jgi:hypothetical protein
VNIKREAAEKTARGNQVIQERKKEYDEAIEKNKDKNYLMAWTVNDLKAVVKMKK